jgi:signal transduction histidine kinase
MMHQFISNNRAVLIARCIAKVEKRFEHDVIRRELGVGVPLFLDQLVRTLEAEDRGPPSAGKLISGPSGGDTLSLSEMGVTAAAHGTELLRMGYSVDQVVHDYGDLCQAITELAFERDAPFEVEEFQTLNRCLDNAIADAVTEFSDQRDVIREKRQSSDARQQLGSLMHEMRNALSSSLMAVGAMEAGSLTLAGATGSVLKRGLGSMKRLIEDALIETHVDSIGPKHSTIFSLAEFINEAADSALLYGESKSCTFVATPVDERLRVTGDRELLLAALANLIGNAFKFTQVNSEVKVRAYEVAGRILIEVSDHCGGLPQGDVERLFIPFVQVGRDRSGVGLGLSIARQSIVTHGGTLTVIDRPGIGCMFTINLPASIPPDA